MPHLGNTGLIHKTPDRTDYKLGQDDGFYTEVKNESGDWSNYLPDFEPQSKEFDTKGCVSFSYNNCQETNYKFQYGEDINFSDRFLAKISGTTKNGNWYKDVAQAARDHGLVKEKDYPWPSDVDTWDEYYQPIPDKILDIAKDFGFDVQYQWIGVNGVSDTDLKIGLKYSPLQVSINAWPEPDSDGVYHCPDWVDSASDTNHAAMLFNVDNQGYKYVFDHYDQEIKKLAPDYYISSAMGHSITKLFMFDLIKGDKDEDYFAVGKDGKKHHVINPYTFNRGVEQGMWPEEPEEKPQSEVDQMETGFAFAFSPDKKL